MAMQTPEKSGAATRVQKYPVPVHPLSLFAREPVGSAMRQIMESFLESLTLPQFSVELEPAVNVYEKDGSYTIECAVPGYKKDDIKIEVRGDQVMISGSYSQADSEEKNHYRRRELRQGSFTRSIELPEEVDAEKVSAKLEDGMLKITLEPTKVIKSKTVPISG